MRFHTFVICAYQESPYLEACIRSLKSQTVGSTVICTTSTPSRYLSRLLETYGIPLYVRQGESDIQADWNFAVSKADSRFVTIAHQDDMYGRHYVEELKKAYEKWPDMTVFMSDAVIVKEHRLQQWSVMELVKKGLRLPLRLRALADRPFVKTSVLMLGNPVMCPSCAYQKEALGEPLFHSHFRFALDWDCMTRLARRQGRFICVERPLLYYRVHDGASTKACIMDHRREREERQMFERFWPRPMVDLLMRFYRKAYSQYDNPQEVRKNIFYK